MHRFLSITIAALISITALANTTVNINSADAQELSDALRGIGLSKARAIVEYREKHGPFQHVDELVNVKGIGLSTVDRFRDHVAFESTEERGRNKR